MAIRGISDKRELPRLGKIKLGSKKMSQRGKEFPEETDHFVLNPQEELLDKNGKVVGTSENEHLATLIEMYGLTPRTLKVVFPVDDEELIAPQYLKWWMKDKNGSGRLACKGDGQYAEFKGTQQVSGLDAGNYPVGFNRLCLMDTCPEFQKKQCKPNMNLTFVVPDYNMFGVFQIDTTSAQAIKNVNSCISVARNALRLQGIGSIAGVPMKLSRKRTPNSHGGVNYILHIEVDVKELTNQKKLMSEGRSNTLALGDVKFTIDRTLLEEPNYDLLPKSDFPERLQTGETVEVLPATINYNDWLADSEIKEKFGALSQLTNNPLTEAKMLATARKFQDQTSLITYLDEKLQAGI